MRELRNSETIQFVEDSHLDMIYNGSDQTFVNHSYSKGKKVFFSKSWDGLLVIHIKH